MPLESILRRGLDRPAVGIAVLGIAIAFQLTFGVAGVGRPGGYRENSYDGQYFYVAGRCWNHGLNAYDPDVYVREAQKTTTIDTPGYFYPPTFTPVVCLLGLFPLTAAMLLLTGINLTTLGILSWLCAGPLRRRREGEGRAVPWLIAAVIFGNPISTHVMFLGQSSLLVATALAGAWVCAGRNQNTAAGLLLAVATLKPQFALVCVVWLILEGRWKILAISAATAVLLSLPAMIVCGPIGSFRDWISMVHQHGSLAANQLGFRHLFGLRSLLHSIGVPAPDLLPLSLLAAFGVWKWGLRETSAEVLGLLLGFSVLFGVAHDYDLVVLAPLLPAFANRPRTAGESMIASAHLLLFYIPQRILRGFDIALLLQFRVPVLISLLAWLTTLNFRDARRRSDGLADPSR
jgi:hypothetical protein